MYMDEVKTYRIALRNHTLDEAMRLCVDAGYRCAYTEKNGFEIEGEVDPVMFFEDMDIDHDPRYGNYYVW